MTNWHFTRIIIFLKHSSEWEAKPPRDLITHYLLPKPKSLLRHCTSLYATVIFPKSLKEKVESTPLHTTFSLELHRGTTGAVEWCARSVLSFLDGA